MKQFVIFGIGRFGASIATTLYNMGHDVLAVDKDEERVQYISDKVTHAIQADATEEATLKAIGIRNFDAAVVAIGEDIQASILITLLCKESGVGFVLSKAIDELHSKVLYKIGADRVVFPERDMGIRVAQSLVSANILDYIQLTPDYSIVELESVPAWENRTLMELDLRAKYGINVMALKRGEEINVSPAGTDTVQKGDVLVVLGKADEIERFQEKSNGKANRK